MPIDYTKDFLPKSTQDSILSVTRASMSGGGKALVAPLPSSNVSSSAMRGPAMRGPAMRGGGYVGVSFLPQRPIGGMLGRLPYGPRCAPVFHQLGGATKKKSNQDCDCESRPIVDKIKKLFMMKGGKNMVGGGAGLITQFSAISQVSPLFASMSMTNVISMIILFFAHSYALQYGEKKSAKSQMMKGGGGGVPILFSQILQPLGMSNLVAIASLLLLHYFAVRNKRLQMNGGGGGMKNAFQSSVVQNELKIQDMIGGSSMYRELRKIFLEEEGIEGGGDKKKKSKLREAVEPLEKDQYIASGMLNLLKGLFSNFYDTQYKSKGKSKKKNPSKRTFLFFKRIFHTMTPISVAIYIRKREEEKKKKSKKMKVKSRK